MAERDRFELDLAGALRAYAEDAPTAVNPTELVRRLAAAHPRGTTTVGPWRLSLTPAIAWLLLLGALLLTATTIIVGAALLRSRDLSVVPVPTTVAPAPVAACPPGTDPNASGPAGQVWPPLAYAYAMAFDSRAGRIVVRGLETETWTFDVCTNTWTPTRPIVEAPTIRSTLVYDAAADLTLGIADGGRVWAYDLAANTWMSKGPVPDVMTYFARLVYDPVSGLVIAQAADSEPLEMWTYAVETDTWTRIAVAGAPGSHGRQIMAYDHSIDQVVVYDPEGFSTWLLNPRTGVWTTSTADTPGMGFDWAVTGGEIAYDEATRQTIAFSGGKVVAYDGRADRWTVLLDPRANGQDAGPTLIGRPTIVYDSYNRRLVAFGAEYPSGGTAWVQPSGVLALDPATSTWTTLLAAEPR